MNRTLRSSLSYFSRVVFIIAILIGLLPPPISIYAENIPTPVSAGDGSVLLIQNLGQFDDHALFQTWGGSVPMWLVSDGFWITLFQPSEFEEDQANSSHRPFEEPHPQAGVNVKISFAGANPDPVIEPLERLETSFDYYLGNDPDQWRSNVPVWGGVRYQDLYPGIDLEVFSESAQTYQRLVVSAGADLSAVKLDIQGADAISVDNGQILLTTSAGDLALPLLQVTGSVPFELPAPSIMGNQVSMPFSTPQAPLEVFQAQAESFNLLYGTFLGGSYQYERAVDAVSDSEGVMYTTGYTISPDFPTTAGGFYLDFTAINVFLVKFNADGSALDYAVLIGGDYDSYPSGLVVDADGSVFISGYTTTYDFPVTANAFDGSSNGMYDSFLVKIVPDTNTLEYSTLIGGSGNDNAWDIAMDSNGDVYLAGSTSSSNFPLTPGALTSDMSDHIFVFKFTAATAEVAYSSVFGSGGVHETSGLAVDQSGNAYVTGQTPSKTFPVTAGAYDTTYNGPYGSDAFLAVLNPDGSALTYASYLGGTEDEYYPNIAVALDGAVYISGYTHSADFPVSASAFDNSYNGGNYDLFVTKLTPNGLGEADLVYSTYIGGSSFESVEGLDVDADGAAHLTGETDSADFPVPAYAPYPVKNDDADGFYVKVAPSGSSLDFSTFFGGNQSDYGLSLFICPNGDVLIPGGTDSTSEFPVTVGAFDTTKNMHEDGFLVKFGIDEIPPAKPTLTSPAGGAVVFGTPRYAWTAPADAFYFIYQYDNNNDFSSPIYTSKQLSVKSFTPPLQAPGIYYWHVKGRDIAGNWSAWSASRKVTIKPLVPAAPILLKPASNAFTNDSTPLLSWKSVPYGKKYLVQVSTKDNFSIITQQIELKPGVLKVVVEDLKDSKYYWRVRAINTLNEKGEWSKIRAFTVDTVPPGPPTLIGPGNNQTVTTIPTTFIWSKVTGAKYYQFDVSKTSNFTTLFYTSSNISVWYKELTLPDGTYFWRVRARDAAGNWSAWSKVWKVIKK
jgi:hypothetical protein